MPLLRTSAVVGLIITVCAGAALAQTVKTDYSRGTDFSSYQTFMWIKDPAAVNPLNNKRIVDGVNAVLTSKGLELVASDADLAVAARRLSRDSRSIRSIAASAGIGAGATRSDPRPQP